MDAHARLAVPTIFPRYTRETITQAVRERDIPPYPPTVLAPLRKAPCAILNKMFILNVHCGGGLHNQAICAILNKTFNINVGRAQQSIQCRCTLQQKELNTWLRLALKQGSHLCEWPWTLHEKRGRHDIFLPSL